MEPTGAESEHAWKKFRASYRREVMKQTSAISELRGRLGEGETITLLCACHDASHCHRLILKEVLSMRETAC